MRVFMSDSCFIVMILCECKWSNEVGIRFCFGEYSYVERHDSHSNLNHINCDVIYVYS